MIRSSLFASSQEFITIFSSVKNNIIKFKLKNIIMNKINFFIEKIYNWKFWLIIINVKNKKRDKESLQLVNKNWK